VRTGSRGSSGHGGLALLVSASGLALVVGGGVSVARANLDTATPSPPPIPRQVAAAPYLMEPATNLEAVEPAEKSRSIPERPRVQGRPHRIVVPRLRIDAPVVGIDAPDGVLLPPNDPTVLGWWRSGARPGAAHGSALITGHTVSSGGGAFDDLETLRRGDRVTVRTTGGPVRYRVTGVTIYRKATLAQHAARVFSQSVPGRLVLITCEDWNGSTYLSNAVVTAEPVT
jgi:LPXTG-site transpeptidase (sortase) family protein